MQQLSILACALALSWCAGLGCGPRQNGSVHIDTRPLEEDKASLIIEEILAKRGYAWDEKKPLQLSNGTQFYVDYQIKNEAIAIELLTEEDLRRIGAIPPAAEGSRLHVISGRSEAEGEGGRAETIFVLFLDTRELSYNANPSFDARADVTFLEVDSRMRRDLADFISWHEDSKAQR